MARLNERQRKFVELYLDSGNITQSVLGAGYDMTPAAAAVHGSRLLKSAKVQGLLREAREERVSKLTINANWVLERISQIAQDDNVTPRDQLKALELLGKYFSMWDRRPDDDQTGVRVVIEDEAEAWAG